MHDGCLYTLILFPTHRTHSITSHIYSVLLPPLSCIPRGIVYLWPQLEIEAALLEGEHRSELSQLQTQEQHISTLKRTKHNLNQSAIEDRERVRNKHGNV